VYREQKNHFQHENKDPKEEEQAQHHLHFDEISPTVKGNREENVKYFDSPEECIQSQCNSREKDFDSNGYTPETNESQMKTEVKKTNKLEFNTLLKLNIM
jgi:hypothetical protein